MSRSTEKKSPGYCYTGSEHEAPELLSLEPGDIAVYSRGGPERGGNEDSALVLPLGDHGTVIAVADGMGGRRAGGRASAVAVQTVAELVGACELGVDDLRGVVVAAIEEAGARIRRQRIGAGTTLVVALIEGDTVRFIHSGDSQGVLVGQRGRVKALTIAHSPVGYAVESGVLDYDEALFHPARHLLSNAVGVGDTRVEVGPRLEYSSRDTVLVGSDGLFDNLFGAELVELSRRGKAMAAAKVIADLVRSRMLSPAEADSDGITPSKPDDLTFALFKPRRSTTKGE